MPELKTSPVMQKCSELRKLGREPLTPDGVAKVKKALGATSGLIVGTAADIVRKHDLQALIPDLRAAFRRLLKDGVKNDKGCIGKTAIIKALNEFHDDDGSLVLAGIEYVQMEPSFGPPEDTAVDVRCECTAALARMNHPDAHFVLAERLIEKETKVRVAAAKALTYIADPESEVMLRLIVLEGDRETEVIGECFQGLMTMSPRRSLPFVRRWLDSRDPVTSEYAGLALGTSHLPEAFAVLKEHWESDPRTSARQSLLLPIALIRSDDAFEFLLGVVKEGGRLAHAAIPAIKLFTADHYHERVREAVGATGDAGLLAELDGATE